MPFPTEHAARISDPKQYKEFARQNNKFGDGIDVIFGVKDDDSTEVQAIRFDKEKFTAAEAREWLRENDYKPIEFEEASGEEKAANGMDSAMVALYLPSDIAQQLALSGDGAIAIPYMHLTLCYLGDIDDISEEQFNLFKRALEMWAKTQVPIKARVNGLARFTKTTDEGTQPLVALIDSPFLSRMADHIKDIARWDADLEISKSYRHGFMPHVTLAYIPQDSMLPIQSLPELSFTLDRLCLNVGPQKFETQLTGEMAATYQDEMMISKAGARHNRRDYKGVQVIHDEAVTLGAKCGEEVKADPDELSEVYSAYKAAVNMSASELETWAETECSKKASLDRRPIERNLRLLRKNKDDWTDKDITDANRTISFVARMKGNLGGSQVVKDDNGNECGTKAHISLKNWAYDSKKSSKASNALKAIKKTDDQLFVGNYLALFGGRDLEGIASDKVNGDGTRGEYFSKSTQFESNYTDTDTVIEDWEHGLMPEADGPGRDDVLGKVLWTTAKADDDGLWVERVLNRRNRYIKLLEPLIEAGLIGTSSEAVPEQVQKSSNGEILVWPLRRDTLTVNPMEPRNLDENCLLALKTLAEDIPQVKNACTAWGIDLDCSDGEGDGGPSRQERAAKIKAKAQAKLRLMDLI